MNLFHKHRTEEKTGTILKFAEDYFIAYFNDNPNIIANGESESEVIENLVFLFTQVRDKKKKEIEETMAELKGYRLTPIKATYTRQIPVPA